MAQQQTKALAPVDDLKQTLARMGDQFRNALPVHIPVDKFVRVLQTAVATTPALVQSTRPSLFAACMRAAADGLLPDGREGAIVTFRNKQGDTLAQWMPMVGGICKKVRNSGELATMDAQVVYENDEYDSWIDEKGQHFKHKKAREDRGKPVLTYAYALTKDGSLYFEEMTEDQVQAVKASSRAKDSGPWSGAFEDEMRRKTAIRRLAKYRLPSSTDLDDVIRRDDDLYTAEAPEPTKQDPAEAAKPSRLSKIIETQGRKVEPEKKQEEPQAAAPAAAPDEELPI